MRLESSAILRVEGSIFFSQSTALSLLGIQNTVISSNIIVGNGSTYAMTIGGSKDLDIRGNTIITGEFAGAILTSTGTYTVTNVNIMQNLFQTQYSVILATSGLFGNNRIIGNEFNSSSASFFITIIPHGDFEFSDNVVTVHYSPNRWDGAIVFSGLDGGSSDLWIIRNNSISGLEDGFYFYSPINLELDGNTIRESLHGVKFYEVNNQSQVTSNIIEDTLVGFYVRLSANNTIEGTTIRRVDFGAIFEFATSNALNNTYIEDFNWLIHDLTNNNPPNQAINSVEVGKKENGIDTQTDSDFEAWASSEGIPGTGTPEDPYVISDLIVDGGLGLGIATNHSIKLKDVMIRNVYTDVIKPLSLSSSSEIILENVTVTGAYNGIFVDSKGPLIITDTSFSGFTESSAIQSTGPALIDGFRYTDSESGLSFSLVNATIMNFEFKNVFNRQIYIGSSANLVLTNGSLSGGGNGIYVVGSTNVTIEKTTINGTNIPFFVSEVFDFIFRENYVTMNEIRGTLEYVDNTNITRNFFVDNKDSAFYTEFSYLNKPFSVWNNYFINNGWNTGTGQILADDDIELTVNGIGNYWSDLTDGATTYNVQGNLFNIDTAPIRPSVDSVDIIKEYGSTVSFDVTTNFPIKIQSWDLYQNGTKLANGSWTGDKVTYSFNPTTLGTYIFDMGIRDINGVQGVNTTLRISVVDTTAPTIVPGEDVTFIEGNGSYKIVWMVSDLLPDSYEIFKNDTIIDSGDWSSPSNLTVDLTALTVGIYNYTLRVYDTSGNAAVDTVIVKVESISGSSDITTTPQPTDTNDTENQGNQSSETQIGTSDNGDNQGKGANWGIFLWILLALVFNSIPLYYAAKSYMENRI